MCMKQFCFDNFFLASRNSNRLEIQIVQRNLCARTSCYRFDIRSTENSLCFEWTILPFFTCSNFASILVFIAFESIFRPFIWICDEKVQHKVWVGFWITRFYKFFCQIAMQQSAGQQWMCMKQFCLTTFFGFEQLE